MSSPTLAFPSIDAAIAQMEGYNTPGTIAQTQNNPGNLVYGPFAQQYGATPGTNGIATFPSAAQGLQAQDALVQYYANKGSTISDLLNAWAPASVPGNDPTGYANYVAEQAGTNPNTPLSSLNSNQTPLTFQGLFNAITGAYSGIPLDAGLGQTIINSSPYSNGQAQPGGNGSITAGRIAAFILGLIFIVAGLFLLKPTQSIVVNTGRAARALATAA